MLVAEVAQLRAALRFVEVVSGDALGLANLSAVRQLVADIEAKAREVLYG